MQHINQDPLLSIIVVTWNAKRYVLECLESLHAVTRNISSEIIVVDNASTDGTPEAVEIQYPDVTLIRNTANVGFATANNIGLSVSRGKYLCLMNSDVVAPLGCCEAMCEYMEKHPDIGLLGPKMLSPNDSVGYSVMRLPTVWNSLCCALGLHVLFPKSGLFGGYQMNGYPYDSIDDVEVLTGWFWMIPRKAFERVGNLDEQYFMYGEDIDWCHRFRAAGWRVVFYPQAQALHYGAASSAKSPVRFYVEMQRANLQYFLKHHGRLGWLGYFTVQCIHHSIRVIGYGLTCIARGPNRSDSVAKVKRSWSCLSRLAFIRSGSTLFLPPNGG